METVAAPAAPLAPRPSRWNWLREGARTLLLMRARWDKLDTGPAFLAILVLMALAAEIGISRLAINGAATFDWTASLNGWAAFVLLAWACYMLRPDPRQRANS